MRPGTSFLQKKNISTVNILKYAAVFFIFLFLFLSFLQIHVYNNDFWWHLANGKFITENHSLPKQDPFAYATHDAPSDRKTVLLKGYWLAEVVFYKVFLLWDLKGIIFLRSLLLLLVLFFVFLTVRKNGVSDLTALIITAGVFPVAMTYCGERPQLFTFAVFSAIYYLLEDFRKNGGRKVFLVPPLVLFLANMHPGYIVCLLLISLYLLAEGILSFRKKHEKTGFKTILVLWTLAIIASLMNPTGLLTFKELFFIREYTQGNVESIPTFSLYAKRIMPVSYPYIFFLAFPLLGLRHLIKDRLVHMLLFAVFSVMSLVSIRYMIFYVCIAAPIIAGIINQYSQGTIFDRVVILLKRKEAFLYVITCILGLFLLSRTIPSFAGYEFKEDDKLSVPKSAADFLSTLKIQGNMFNEYGFGGYLLWRLNPEKKVFIDGRIMEYDVLLEYNRIASAFETGQPTWEQLLERNHVTYIIMPPLLPQGNIFPLVEKLLERDDWVLIYRDHLSLVFLRDSPGNRPIREKYGLDKEKGFETIIIQASARALKNQANPRYLISLGKSFYETGRMDEAEKAFMMAYERDPRNQVIEEWLNRVREKKKS